MEVRNDNILISLFQSIKDKRLIESEDYDYTCAANSTINNGFIDNKK